MTEKGAYEAILTELRKVKAPHIHLEDFNYFINKGIQEFINEEYTRFETVQQTSDALNSITSFVNFKFNYSNPNAPTVTITGNSILPQSNIPFISGNRYNSKFVQVNFPENYFHLLNCVTDVKALFNYKCYPAGYIHSSGTKKYNADSAPRMMQNAWLKPNYNRPFYKLLDHANVILTANQTEATNEASSPDIQVYYGDNNKFTVDNIYSEYLRKPRIVNLTSEQIDSITDTSNRLDFTDYVCNEIIKRVVRLLLENSKDPRLQTFIPTNVSVK